MIAGELWDVVQVPRPVAVAIDHSVVELVRGQLIGAGLLYERLRERERNKEREIEGSAAILDSSDGPFVCSDTGSPSGDVQTWLQRILNMPNKTHIHTLTRPQW